MTVVVGLAPFKTSQLSVKVHLVLPVNTTFVGVKRKTLSDNVQMKKDNKTGNDSQNLKTYLVYLQLRVERITFRSYTIRQQTTELEESYLPT